MADFIGLDVCLSILEVMHKGFENPKYAPSKILIDMVSEGKLGIKSGEGFYDYSDGSRNKKILHHNSKNKKGNLSIPFFFYSKTIFFVIFCFYL